jgi:hypothetical protein
MPNYVQPDFRVPSAPGVGVQLENHANYLNVTWPIPAYTQPSVLPAAPVFGQLSGSIAGMLGTSSSKSASGVVTST